MHIDELKKKIEAAGLPFEVYESGSEGVCVLGFDVEMDCPECGGGGRAEYEVPVVDYEHGGYLKGEMRDCERCEGSGEVWFMEAEYA